MISDPEYPRTRQAESDRKLLALSKESIEHSRQLLIETEPQTNPHRIIAKRNSISVFQACDEWHVIVDEDGQELVTCSFEEEQHAVIYAEGERLRLALGSIARF